MFIFVRWCSLSIFVLQTFFFFFFLFFLCSFLFLLLLTKGMSQRSMNKAREWCMNIGQGLPASQLCQMSWIKRTNILRKRTSSFGNAICFPPNISTFFCLEAAVPGGQYVYICTAAAMSTGLAALLHTQAVPKGCQWAGKVGLQPPAFFDISFIGPHLMTMFGKRLFFF